MKDPLVGKALTAARKSAGLTQAELGQRVGVSGSAVGQWEQGRTHPSWKQAQRLVEVLAVEGEVADVAMRLAAVERLARAQAQLLLLLGQIAAEQMDGEDEIAARLADLERLIAGQQGPAETR